MLKIGTLKLSSNVLLAPLAGISDSSFRLICREFGAGFTFVEMINARALSHKSKKTKKMLAVDKKDTPIGVQIVGCELPHIKRAVDVINRYDFDILDFNAACPVRKVCRRGEGAAMMREPKKLAEILKLLAKFWHKPLTIKLRSGWDENARNAVEIARIAEDCGVNAIFIHGRDRQQFYKGTVDYSAIAEVKKNVSVPVIASGDIWSAKHAQKMFDQTGCDGILVARGALGNPWIFKEIEEYFETGRVLDPPSTDEIIDTLLHHLDLSIAEHTEKRAVPLMRKFAGWYFKNRPNVRCLRHAINPVKTRKEFAELLEALRGR